MEQVDSTVLSRIQHSFRSPDEAQKQAAAAEAARPVELTGQTTWTSPGVIRVVRDVGTMASRDGTVTTLTQSTSTPRVVLDAHGVVGRPMVAGVPAPARAAQVVTMTHNVTTCRRISPRGRFPLLSLGKGIPVYMPWLARALSW